MKRILVTATSVALALSAVGLTPPAASAAPALPLSPEPQSILQTADGFRLTPTARVILGEDSDDVSLNEVRRLLAEHGVTMVDVVEAPAEPGKSFTIWLGDAPAAVLGELGVEPADDLPAEGYALTVGRDSQDRKLIVIDGVDADGTYYATQTLRQLMVDEARGKDSIPGATVRDWPATEYRGSIEGFYGTPWTHEQRLDHLRYLGAHKMNTYVYTPKDDPYLRVQWREPYPEADRARISELVDEALAHKVDFTYAVSPGLSVCYSSPTDRQALVDKFQSVYDLGVRSFVVPLDDIEYTRWNCAEDAAVYGSGQAAAGRAQADLLNHVQQWIETLPDVMPLQLVPTQYYDVADSPYKESIRQHMDPDVIVQWTGVGVVAPVITKEQAEAAAAVWERDIVIWDNFPVNDYAPGRLLLGDFAGREPGVTEVVSGILSNPMNQAAVSKIAFYSFAEYSWNPSNYDPAESHARALEEVAAGDPGTAAALRVFADLNWFDGQIHRESAPQLAADVDSFWDAWNSGARASAVDALRPRADDVAEAPETIRAGVDDELFVAEADAWLRATELWGKAMQQSLLLLSALDSDDGAAAWSARQRITAHVAEALAIRDTTVVHNQTHPRIAEGVLDTFVAEVVRLHDRWSGAKRGVTAQTNLPVYQTYTPALMADGDLGTWFWSSRAVRTGDYVQLDLGSVAGIGDISLQMARDASPGDYFHQGTLEYSVDGSTWTPLISAEAAVVETTAPAGTEARYVRYRATADNVPANWAIVREFQVEVRSDGVPRVTSVRSVPAPAEGSDANRAADGDPATAFVAGRAPVAGDLLEIDYSQAADLSGITVLQRADQAGTGVLEARSEGVWVGVGTVSGEYARTSLDLPAVDALRILWAPGATAPAVAEVIPVWASEGVPLLTAPELDLVRGEPTVVEVVLSAPVGSASSGRVTLSAPADWVVAPESVAVSVPSGLSQSVAFTLTPPASAPLEDVELVASLTDADGSVVVEVPVVAHVRPVVGEVNVALGRPVLASGVEPGTAHQPAFAVDGRLDTRWASGYDDASWWQVDLGSSMTLGRVDIEWEAAAAKDYLIQVSEDGVSWTTAATVVGSDGGHDIVWLDAAGRHVRMQGVARATQWGYSMFEFEVRRQA